MIFNLYSPANSQNLEEITAAEVEFGQEVEVYQTEEEDELELIPGIERIFSTDDQHQMTDDEAHIVYQQPLLRLARLRIGPLCNNKGCGQHVDLITESVGSALYIKWVRPSKKTTVSSANLVKVIHQLETNGHLNKGTEHSVRNMNNRT